MPVARRTLGRVLLPAAWSLPLPHQAALTDGRARPLLLSFGLRRALQGAGLVAAGGETSHSPLVREHPPHQSFPPATGSETRFAVTFN